MLASFESEFLDWVRGGYTDAGLYLVGAIVVLVVVMRLTTRG